MGIETKIDQYGERCKKSERRSPLNPPKGDLGKVQEFMVSLKFVEAIGD